MNEATIVTQMHSVVLPPSSVVRMECLRNADSGRLTAHFLALPPERLAERFDIPVCESSVRDYVARRDLERDIVVALSEPDGTILVTAWVAFPTPDAHWAELSFTALPGEARYRACERAISVAVARARQAGLASLVINGSGFDLVSRSLLARLGFRLTLHEGGFAGEIMLRDARDDE